MDPNVQNPLIEKRTIHPGLKSCEFKSGTKVKFTSNEIEVMAACFGRCFFTTKRASATKNKPFWTTLTN